MYRFAWKQWGASICRVLYTFLNLSESKLSGFPAAVLNEVDKVVSPFPT